MANDSDANTDLSRASDRLHGVISAAAGSVPIVGRAVEEAFRQLVADPALARRDRFLLELSSELSQLADHLNGIEARLKSDEDLNALIVEGVAIANRTAKPVKLAAIRNVLLNSTISEESDLVAERHILTTLDRMSEYQILILSWLSNGRIYTTSNMFDDILGRFVLDISVEIEYSILEVMFNEMFSLHVVETISGVLEDGSIAPKGVSSALHKIQPNAFGRKMLTYLTAGESTPLTTPSAPPSPSTPAAPR